MLPAIHETYAKNAPKGSRMSLTAINLLQVQLYENRNTKSASNSWSQMVYSSQSMKLDLNELN